VEKPGKRKYVFSALPHTLEIATGEHRTEHQRSDFQFPRPAGSMNQFQSRKDKTRFAYPSLPSGHLGLEKTIAHRRDSPPQNASACANRLHL